MKKNWIVIIIIFLLAVNAAFLATLVIQNNRISKHTIVEANDNDRSRHWNKHKNEHKLGFGDQLVRDLDMDKEQTQQLQEVRKNYKDNKNSLSRQIRNVKHEIKKVVISGDNNDTALDELADSLGRLTTEMIVLNYEHYENIKLICSPEQADKMDSLGKIHMLNYGKKGYGRRQGTPQE